jgi:putative adhesin
MDTTTYAAPAPPAPAPESGGRTAVKVLLVLLALVLVAWCALTVVSLLGRDTARSSASYGGIRSVDLDLGFESVTVVGKADATRVSMRRSYTWSVERPEVDHRVDGDVLRMSSSCSWSLGLGCSGSVRLEVPAGTVLRMHTSDGDLSVRAVTGDLDIATSDGDVELADVGGTVRLRTRDGSVDADGLSSAAVDARTSDGDLRLGFATAPTDVRTVSRDGSITVLVPRDDDPWRVSGTTRDGSRNVDVATDPAAGRRISARTSDGSVDVRYAG